MRFTFRPATHFGFPAMVIAKVLTARGDACAGHLLKGQRPTSRDAVEVECWCGRLIVITGYEFEQAKWLMAEGCQ